MALPTAYLTTTKNLSGILSSITSAKAPEKFTNRFLESLEYKGSNDRLIIGVLKALKFIADDGRPLQRYFEYLDQSKSGRVLADGITDAYEDLFQVNINANRMTKAEVLGKLKTLTQGQNSEAVLDKMAMTFSALCTLADFSASPLKNGTKEEADENPPSDIDKSKVQGKGISFGGLVYNIQLILPESRDPKVYDALFESLKKHLT